MNKNSLLIGIVGVVIGFFIGFYWTNALNRAVIKEAEDKARQAALAPGATNPGQTDGMPQDDIHKGMSKLSPDDIERAIKAAEASRNDLELQTKVGRGLYYEAKRLKEARECFEAALKLKPDDFQLNVDLGNLSFDEDKFEAAASCYEKALKINANNPDVRTDLGNTYFMRKPPQFAKAIEQYKISLQINPNHAPTLRNLALAFIQQKNFADAKTAVDKLAQVDPQNEAIAELRAQIEKSPTDTKRDIPTH